MSSLIKMRFWCNEHGYVGCGIGEPIEAVNFDQRGELGLLCPLCHKARPMKLERHTGLKDKNGVEIYEGDIVRFTYWWFDGNEAESELIGSVVYIKEHASYGLEGVKNVEWIKHIGGEDGSSDTSPFANWTFNSDDIEVIGNIYETLVKPEFL